MEPSKEHSAVKKCCAIGKRAYRLTAVSKPHIVSAGCRRRLHLAAKESMLGYQQQHPWAYQDQLAMFVEDQWEFSAHRSSSSWIPKALKMIWCSSSTVSDMVVKSSQSIT